jgi:hypothetical protein
VCVYCDVGLEVRISFNFAALSKAWAFGRALPGIAASNPTRGDGFLSLVSAVCCQVEVSARG